MGCAASTIGPLWHPQSFNPVEFFTKNKIIMDLATPEKNLIKKANSEAAVAIDEHSLVVLTSASTLVVVSTLPFRCQNRTITNYPKSRKKELTSKEGTTIPDLSTPHTPRDAFEEHPPNPEQGDFELPKGNFVDGKLGIADENTINTIKSSLRTDELFTDPDFPANDQSLYFVDKYDPEIEWKRPHQLVENPQLFVKGVDRRDVIQGSLGDCWFLSSCSAVARTPKLIEKVIPTNQTLIGDDYQGFIMVRFWRFGSWTTVIVDDLLPTKNGNLTYAHSEDKNEFWVALLEKAYAKIHGTYQALEGGQSMDAMVDLTGGLPERFDMEDTPDQKKLFKYLTKATQNGAFITASIKGDWRQANKANDDGLVEGHAYTVSGVSLVTHLKLGNVPLVRIRNPWGNEAEWKGAWSDGDVHWDHVSNEMRVKLLMDDKDDGEFWMSFSDFHKQFEEVSLCRMGPDFDEDGDQDKAEQVRAIRGSWVVGKNAGGSRNNFKTFATNPQFLLTFNEDADDEENEIDDDDYDENEPEKSHTHSVLIGLTQEHRLSRRDEGIKMNQIAFCVYKAPDTSKRIPLAHFLHNYDVGTSGTYINYREVICSLKLNPGNYVIIPAMFAPDIEGEFMIRVYCPKKFHLCELE